jgi:uncharacterized membrane protein
MSTYTSVPVSRALEWIKDGFQIFMRNPLIFTAMSLTVIVAQFVPFVGTLLALAMPILQAGILYAIHQQENGGEAKYEHLFAGFSVDGKIVPLIILCLPALALGVLVLVVFFLFFGAAFFAAMASASTSGNPQDLSALSGALAGGGLFIGMGIAMLLMLVYIFLMQFALPRVMLDGIDPVSAMVESLKASFANIGALLFLYLLMFIALVLMVIIPVVGWLALFVFMFVAIALTCAISYRAYREVFAGSEPIAAVIPPPAPSV